jgi:hypothetical protein
MSVVTLWQSHRRPAPVADAEKAGLEAGFQDTGKKFKIDIYQCVLEHAFPFLISSMVVHELLESRKPSRKMC